MKEMRFLWMSKIIKNPIIIHFKKLNTNQDLRKKSSLNFILLTIAINTKIPYRLDFNMKKISIQQNKTQDSYSIEIKRNMKGKVNKRIHLDSQFSQATRPEIQRLEGLKKEGHNMLI